MLYTKPKAKPTDILLLSDWMGTKAGTNMSVWSDVASHLVERGVAEYVVEKVLDSSPALQPKPERKKHEFKRVK
jgi:hypothetical protein